jgi:hypothetical protein
MKETGLHGRITLKRILNKEDVMMWTVLICLVNTAMTHRVPLNVGKF